MAFGDCFEFEGSIVTGKPVGMAFALATFGFSSEHDDYAGILFPGHTPEVLLPSAIVFSVV